MSAPTAAQLTTSLTSQNLPTPSPQFLTSILTSSTASARLPPERILTALTATARHRLITSDLTSPLLLSPTTPSIPATLSDIHTPSTSLPQDLFLQVLQIEDLSKSLWEQIEALESERKGETTKGREIIRVVAADAGNENGSSAATQAIAPASGVNATGGGGTKGPFKLQLQDWKGNTIFGFEVKRVEKVGYPPVMSIGCKVFLRKGTKVARGMVLLEPGRVVVVGGRVEGLDKAWVEGREKSLRARVKREGEERVAAAAAAPRGGRGGRGGRGRGA